MHPATRHQISPREKTSQIGVGITILYLLVSGIVATPYLKLACGPKNEPSKRPGEERGVMEEGSKSQMIISSLNPNPCENEVKRSAVMSDSAKFVLSRYACSL